MWATYLGQQNKDYVDSLVKDDEKCEAEIWRCTRIANDVFQKKVRYWGLKISFETKKRLSDLLSNNTSLYISKMKRKRLEAREVWRSTKEMLLTIKVTAECFRFYN